MKTYSFHVRIEEGNIVFNSKTHKDMFKRWLGQWNDKDVSLEVKLEKRTRSGEQNRYYWLYLGIIEEETGNDKEILHSYFKNKFLTTSITELYGDKVRVAKSTTELTKGEFGEYLAKISEITEIELPDTTAFFGYSYHK